MKWYSVKKYMPPMHTDCLVFTENNYYYVARLIDSSDYAAWVADYECEEHGSYTQELCGITHFCIPDPIEIESEEIKIQLAPRVGKILVEKIQRAVDSVSKNEGQDECRHEFYVTWADSPKDCWNACRKCGYNQRN